MMNGSRKIVPVIMSGGAGSRLWPMSRQACAKQFLPLASDETMIQETVARFEGDLFHDPVFICNAAHTDLIREQVEHIGALILEPQGRNTGPCAMVAALHAQTVDPDALLLLAPADHVIERSEAFRDAIKTGSEIAAQGYHVTFGMKPDHAATGFGYIQQGEALSESVFAIERFREKPDQVTAQTYLEQGGFHWNSGIFLLNPTLVIEEMLRLARDCAAPAQLAYKAADRSGQVISLDPGHFATCKAEPIDIALMERTSKGAVLPCDLGWADIGSFAAYRDFHATGDDTVIQGDGYAHAARRGLITTDGPTVALVGLDNVGVIVRDGRVLVIDLDQAQDVKAVVNQLKSEGRTDKL